MKWYNLRKNCCAKCGKKLEFNKDEEMLFCGDLSCGFQISQYRMERLVASMTIEPYVPKDNFRELQNIHPDFLVIDEVGDVNWEKLGM